MNLDKVLQEAVEQVDVRSIVTEEVRALVRSDLQEIEQLLAGEVTTDDGWGRVKIYSSFEELFKQTFSEAVHDRYEVRRLVADEVNSKVYKMLKDNLKTVVAKIATELTEEQQA